MPHSKALQLNLLDRGESSMAINKDSTWRHGNPTVLAILQRPGVRQVAGRPASAHIHRAHSSELAGAQQSSLINPTRSLYESRLRERGMSTRSTSIGRTRAREPSIERANIERATGKPANSRQSAKPTRRRLNFEALARLLVNVPTALTPTRGVPTTSRET